MKKNKYGFSLIELLSVLFILSTLMIFAIPSYKFFLQQSDNQTLSAKLLNAIYLTQQEAINRGIPVTLCGSEDMQQCITTWNTGFIITAKDNVIYSVTHSNSKGNLYWRSFHSNTLTFLPSGFTNTDNGTFWYCQKNASKPRWAITVGKLGRTRLIYPEQASEIRDGKDQVLSC